MFNLQMKGKELSATAAFSEFLIIGFSVFIIFVLVRMG